MAKADEWRAKLPRIELGEHGKPVSRETCRHPLSDSVRLGGYPVAEFQCNLCGEIWDKDIS